MSNMSYCRFENTNRDLRDCVEWLSGNDPSELSETEQIAFKSLIKKCVNLALDYGAEVDMEVEQV